MEAPVQAFVRIDDKRIRLRKQIRKPDYLIIQDEIEFAAASLVLGASAAGARTYTATTSQGLLLMTEVLYCIAGCRFVFLLEELASGIFQGSKSSGVPPGSSRRNSCCS